MKSDIKQAIVDNINKVAEKKTCVQQLQESKTYDEVFEIFFTCRDASTKAVVSLPSESLGGMGAGFWDW